MAARQTVLSDGECPTTESLATVSAQKNGRPACKPPAGLRVKLLRLFRRRLLVEFFFQLGQIEACALLHWREVDRALCQLPYLLLDEHEAPELECEPVVVIE